MGREEGKSQPNQAWSQLVEAQAAFLDPPGVIAADETHNKKGTPLVLHWTRSARNSHRAF